jgi:hypothetical protein
MGPGAVTAIRGKTPKAGAKVAEAHTVTVDVVVVHTEDVG